MGKIVASYLVKVHLHQLDEDDERGTALADALTNDVVEAAIVKGVQAELGGEVTVSLIERTDD